MKNHLAGNRKDVAACKHCPKDVTEFFKQLLDDRASSKDMSLVDPKTAKSSGSVGSTPLL